jgi:peptide/nickel transport system permease protein
MTASPFFPALQGRQARVVGFAAATGIGRRAALLLGSAILLTVIVGVIFAPLLAAHSAVALDLNAVLHGPSLNHPFGTDQFGRDIFARTLNAGRIDHLLVAAIVTTGFIIGTTLGIIAGWAGGWFDSVLTRVIDVALGFPFLVLVICVIGMRGPGLMSLYVAVSLVSWVYYARLVREEVRLAKRLDYMQAAKASDFPSWRIITRHLLPNVIVQPLVYASSDCVYALLLGAAVSFLGLGVQPPRSEWGQMVALGVPYVSAQWWMSTFPGLAIVMTGIAFSLIADGLSDAVRVGRSP